MTLHQAIWRFAIDVGGTFTDCIGYSPAGEVRRQKLLSSGITQGDINGDCTPASFVDARRKNDPENFWRGFELRIMDDRGEEVGSAVVQKFDAQLGQFFLATKIPALADGSRNWRYELRCDLAAPVIAIRYLLGCPLDQALPPTDVRLGTTRGTNALLTRTGAATALVTTRGFGDILHIRDQQRPHLFELNIQKPTPLFQQTLEVDERVAADGEVLQSLDIVAVRESLQRLRESGIKAIAICFLHGYAHPVHEVQVGNVAADMGFEDISLSHAIAPLMKIVPRADTTVVNAYLNPVLTAYRRDIESSLISVNRTNRLRWMTSAGGLVSGDSFCGKESVLSGPAGGVVGFSRTATGADFDRTIGFDMGGTSTDVARYDGKSVGLERVYETQKAGVHLSTPMLAIETVAAGGGSICGFDGVQITVGPASAGADPGPACYGRGGPLTVTDMNLILGRIYENRFPFPLDKKAVVEQLTMLCKEIQVATGEAFTPQRLAEGMVRLANSKMANAIQSISTAKGYDPREYTLAGFGGAAPQHACAVARELGIHQILIHPDAGILSAVGIGIAPSIRSADRGIYQSWNDCRRSLPDIAKELSEDAKRQLRNSEPGAAQIDCHVRLDIRYLGQDATLSLDYLPIDSLPIRFHESHAQRYGYQHPDREIEVVAAHTIATCKIHDPPMVTALAEENTANPAPADETHAVFDGAERRTPIFDRSSLLPGQRLDGPAIIAESLSTTVVEPDWQATVLPDGQLLLTDQRVPYDGHSCPSTSTEQTGDGQECPSYGITSLDPVTLEVFNNAFAGIADQMGQTLRNTATSVNVKERLDFSCALFDGDGNLVVNAPHVPVHLGAMSETIRHLVADHPDMVAGDVFITNDPYRGGSHLPDVTVITPVFDANHLQQRLYFAANRAHHAEIGGIAPGSMPPFSKRLSEEGVLIPSQRVVAAGTSRLEQLRALLSNGPYPSRAVEDNLADIAAQIAANQQGVTRLSRLTAQHGAATVTAAMQQLLTVAQAKTHRALRQLGDGQYQFEDQLDDGSAIRVQIDVKDGNARVDFTGCADVHAENLNANRGIVQAALIYALRCLIDEELPINQGILNAVKLTLPTGILNPVDQGDAARNPAVVGGNVETSQRIVDVLLGALGLAAASQGTMNNLLFGDDSFGYYETICGGAGATKEADGASAVHTHMTNTRLTDPEVFESRFPVRLHAFHIRRGSGGAGKHHGGDGIVRKIEFLAPLSVSLLTQRRTKPPYGIQGGEPGASGENLLQRASERNGTQQALPSRIQLEVQPGDVLTIKTPGGGGFGSRS